VCAGDWVAAAEDNTFAAADLFPGGALAGAARVPLYPGTLAACPDAALDRDQVDGIASYMVGVGSENAQALATALALPGLWFVVYLHMAGQAPCHLVGLATQPIASGPTCY
jgi:hypothetical protein